MGAVSGAGRLFSGARVGVAVVLAGVTALLSIEAADWTFLRVDLSRDGRNTLDPATLASIERAEGEVMIETFLRPLARPFDQVSAEAIAMTSELLFLAGVSRRDSLKIVHHDMSDLAAVRQRQGELGVEGENLLVVSVAERRATVSLFGEVAVVDWGNPTVDGVRYLVERGIPNVVDPRSFDPERFRPARMVDFRGEEALAGAIAKVASGQAPRVYFSTGQGERSAEGTLTESISALRGALERDGFRSGVWDPTSDGAVPDDCELLCVIGPRQPFGVGQLEHLRTYLGRGGRLICALGLDAPQGEGSLAALLSTMGLRHAPGVVCEAVVDALGRSLEGVPQCAVLQLGPAGMGQGLEITEPLRLRDRRVVLSNSTSFDRGASPDGWRMLSVLHTAPGAWRDRVDERTGARDYALDPARERSGVFDLCVLLEQEESRVLALASAAFFSNGYLEANRDFLMNAFNWMVERDSRVGVAARPDSSAMLDLTRGARMATLSWILWLILPAACAVAGLAVGRRRRRA